MAVSNLRSRPIYVWIPPEGTTTFKLVIELSDGTELDITDLISGYNVEDHVTESIGQFEITLHDPNEDYYNTITGGETFYYYKDYAAEATTLKFKGIVEKPSKNGNKLKIKGRSESLKIFGITVTKQFEDTEVSAILTSIFNTYLPEFTTTNVNTTTTNLTVNWYQKPLFDCIKALCDASGSEFYINANSDVNFFESGSVINTTDAIVHDYNMLSIEDFSPDYTLIRNRIIVYGSEQQGIQPIATAESDDSDYGINSNLGVKEEIINDDNITTDTQAQETANYFLDELQNPPEVGSIKGIMLATIQPGDTMRLSSPADGLPPNNYFTSGYKDEYSNDSGMFTTTVYINKEPRKISHIIRNRVENENNKKQTSINPEEMKYSYNFLFNSITGDNNNTLISEGVLYPLTINGEWVSDTLTETSNFTEAYLILNGEKLNDVKVYVSTNNGITYTLINNRTKLDLTDKPGSNLKIKVVFENIDSRVNSLSILYNK